MLPNILGTSIRYIGNPIDQPVQWDDRWFWTLLNRGSCFWRSQICFFPIWPSIGRYCGWNLDVVPLQSDEKRWYEVYQSLLLEFRKDAKWIKKTLWFYNLWWMNIHFPAILISSMAFDPTICFLARSKAGGSASMVALLKGDSQEQVRVGMARESLRDPKILWIPRVYPLVN